MYVRSPHFTYGLLSAATALVVTLAFVVGPPLFAPTPEPPSDATETQSVDDFTVAATYQGDETWEYTITGVVPNRCTKVEPSVQEQDVGRGEVDITLFMYKVEDESLCAKRPQTVALNGTFAGSFETDILFSIDEQVTQDTPTGLPKKSS